jgi:hypothetical protein
MKRATWIRGAKWAGGGAVAGIAIVGALHMPWAKPLLQKIGGCPVGKATAAQVEEVRRGAVASARGTMPAPARPALGFALDASTPDEVRAWADRNHVSCTEKREGMLLACKDVPLAALGADRSAEAGRADDVSFAFRPRDRALVNVTVTAYALSSDEAAARMQRAAARLEGSLGAPTTASGDASAAHLASARFATATVEYRFSDFLAEATATSFGAQGVAVREHFVSARD